MNLKLPDKTAFVTASTAGIGLAVARRLAAERAVVLFDGRTWVRLDAAIATLRQE